MHDEEQPQQPSNPEAPPAPAVPAESPGETQQPEPQPVQGTPVTPGMGPTDAHDQDEESGDALPDDLQSEVHEGPVEPDEVDQKDVQE